MTAAAIDLRETSKAERVYGDLRRRIRELALPPGAPLRKEELALELGVSRAPVSEAIARLAEEGLAEVLPQHGKVSSPRSGRQRTMRESPVHPHRRWRPRPCAASCSPADHPPSAGPARRQAGRPGRGAGRRATCPSNFYDLDEGAACGLLLPRPSIEPWRTTRLLERRRAAPLDRDRRLALPEPGRPEATYAEHLRLVDAVRSGDAEFAAAAMRVHLAMVGRTVERELSKMEGAPVRRA